MSNEKQEVVNLKAKKELVATEKHPVLKKGTIYTCGELVAPKHVSKGFASEVSKTAVEAEAETKAKK